MILFSSLFLYFYSMVGDMDSRLDVLAQIEKELIVIVQDNIRKAKAIDVVEKMKVTVKKQHADYKLVQSDYLKINADYSADKKQYDDLETRVDGFWRSTMKQQLDLRFSLHDHLTRAEWEKLYKEIN